MSCTEVDSGIPATLISPSAALWLAESVAAVEADPMAIDSLFAAASRRTAREPLVADDPFGFTHGCVDDAAHAALIAALPDDGALASRVSNLYRYGDAGEKRGVLRGLHGHAGLGAALLPEIEDALRTNDARLVAAALQPYGAKHLSDAVYRHAIVKCVFVGVPLSAVHGLNARADAELARMLVDLSHERVAAGRSIPTDVGLVLTHFPEAFDRGDLPPDVVAAIADKCTVISSTATTASSPS